MVTQLSYKGLFAVAQIRKEAPLGSTNIRGRV